MKALRGKWTNVFHRIQRQPDPLSLFGIRIFSWKVNDKGNARNCVIFRSKHSRSESTSFRPAIPDPRKKSSSRSSEMSWFVIGVESKTSFTKLIQRTFPWAQIVHQDHYFYDDDWPHHIRVPEAENHVNYEIFNALNMDKMYKDVQNILEGPPKFTQPEKQLEVDSNVGDKAETPNFDEATEKFIQQIPPLKVNVSKYNHVPILIIEGFTIFASQFLFDKCHARFFFSLDKETCQQRRSERNYFPPDSPNYFKKIVWPEYEKHLDQFINKRPGLTVFEGDESMETILRNAVQIITCRLEEKNQKNTISSSTIAV
ncbi:Nicotinamide riboside kinase 1 [Orchesella cincta]|uniref:Nicotinamide riboside kinase 1 n=1 Tax=Orchesella cincta TaxID=48709 RepID=A0A1D2NF71_ORCCI|nr:Nicotinamide riboside kinase 1 [Orchesella cincta]